MVDNKSEKKTKKDESLLEKTKDLVADVVEGVENTVDDVVEVIGGKIENFVEKNEKKIAKEKLKKGVEIKKSTDKDLKEAAEAESKATEETVDAKRKALLEKAKKLAAKIEIDGPTSEELKEKVKAKKKSETLLPLDDYVKSGIYLGTRVVTPDMRKYVYRRRADGLAILNTDIIDEKIKEGIEYLSKFNPEDIIVVCKRQAGWKAVDKFSQLTGIRVFTKKYPAGILTNTDLPDFFEVDLAVICDSWLDKNALNDIRKIGKNILMISDTNNFARLADEIIIGNNKSNKSLGLIFYLLTRGYMKAKGMDTSQVPDLEWWTGEIEDKVAAVSERKLRKKVEEVSEMAEMGV